MCPKWPPHLISVSLFFVVFLSLSLFLFASTASISPSVSHTPIISDLLVLSSVSFLKDNATVGFEGL